MAKTANTLPPEQPPISVAPISLADALAVIARNYSPATDSEIVALGTACGRVLAADIVAPIAVPAADNSAVDGYAFRHADLAPHDGTALRIAGTAAAGHPYQGQIAMGEAVRIFTGAVMPAGADTVVPQEDVSADAVTVTIPAGRREGDNRRHAGEDIAIGSRILMAGDRLEPAAIGMLASIGLGRIGVYAPLKAAVFSAGDELRDVGGQLAPGQIHDSNRPVLLAMLKGLGIVATDLGILPDRPDIIRARLSGAAKSHHAVICSAGMSVGDEDHVKSAVRALGTLNFWSVAIKPGRPIAVGRIGEVPFFGLPGNPVAMIVTFLMIVRPALLRLSGAQPPDLRRFPVTADFSMARRPGKREFLRCTLQEGDRHSLLARRFERGGSGVLSSVAASEGLLEIGEEIADIAPGMVLPFMPFSALGL
ncbi:MAG: molybdopterin molybdenumtransferase MoeA [Rhodospirillales bacterium]|nr:molybdopterin molybdenumtransferase MoeA [Rhodospirillales bacterium]